MIPRLNNVQNVDVTNPVVKGIENNNIIPNPAYNPKTKKGRMEAPYIQDTSTNDFRNSIGTAFSQTSDKVSGMYSDYGYSTEDFDKYTRNNLGNLKNKTKEELDKILADKQSWIEQTGNMVTQAVTNEVILGTLLGLSNTFDFVANLGTKEGEDDYTNPLSTYIEEAQDYIRKKFEIHRANPNETFDVGDWGWWMDNAVSVMSTASMLIPTLGITKGVSYLGRATKLGRAIGKGGSLVSHSLARGINTLTKPFTGVDRIGRIEKSISNGSEIAANAILSRTMENYMEARETYKEVYNDALAKVNNFSDEDRLKFNTINPDLADKSNEEIAAHIASLSADETFQNDYAMLLMDIVQFKALKNLWKGNLKNNASGGMRSLNERFASAVNSETNAIEKVTLRDRINFIRNHPGKAALNSVGSIEFTEGIEEGYQGIQVEKGKEIAERIFNPQYIARNDTDYLTDDKILEQAFWGVIGGFGFKHIGNGFGRLMTEIDIAHNKKFGKDKYTDEEIALKRMGVEKQQIAEIKGREARIRKFNSDMQNLNNGNISNVQTVKDEKGNDILDDDGNKIYKELSQDEVVQEKQDTIDAFITDMTIDAALAGNYDLLREYVKNPQVQQLLKESGQEVEFTNQLLNKMDDVYEKYRSNLYNIFNSVDVVNQYVGHHVARDITLDQIRLEQTKDILNETINATQELNGKAEDIEAYIAKIRQDIINEAFKGSTFNINGVTHHNAGIEDTINYVEKAYANNEISRQAYEKYIKDINKKRQAIINYANSYIDGFNSSELQDTIDGLSNTLKNIINSVNTTNTGNANNITGALKELLNKQLGLEVEVAIREALLPITQEDIEDNYKLKQVEVDNFTKLMYLASANEVRNWLQNQDNLNEAAKQLADGNVEELGESLDILKMGHNTTQAFIGSIKQEINREIKRRNDEARAEEEVKVDGQTVTPTEAEQIRSTIPDDDPFTGEGEQTETSATIATDDSGQIVDATVDESYDNTTSESEKQAIEDAKKINDNYELSNDAIAASTASNILMEMLKNDKSIVDTLKKGINNSEYNDLIDKVKLELITRGVSQAYAREAAEKGMIMFNQVLNNALKDNYFLRLAAEIATNATWNKNDMASATPFIGEKDLNETIETFIEEYCKENNIPINPKGHTVVNTRKLLKDIIENPNINIETAKYLIRNMRDYLASNNSKKFIFDNRSIIYKLKSNISDIIQDIKYNRATPEVIANEMHIELPSAAQTAKREEAKKKLLGTTGDEQIQFIVNPRGNDISVRLGDTEIGYLGKVTIDADGSNLRLVTQTRGFQYSFTKINTNNLNEAPNSNLDNFFNEIIDNETDRAKELWPILTKYYNYRIAVENGSPNQTKYLITDNDVATIFGNQLFKSVYGKQFIARGSQKTTMMDFLDRLSTILFYDIEAVTASEMRNSFKVWKIKMYNNYIGTKKIQDISANNGRATASISQIRIKNTNYSDSVRVNASQLNDRYKANPLVYFIDDSSAIDDNGVSYTNNGTFRRGGTGILLFRQNNVPIIASIVDTIKAKDSKFGTAIRNELTDLITSYSKGTINFEALGRKLSNLIGGVIDGNGAKGNHLLSGASVIQTNDKIFINIGDDIKVAFYRNRKDKKVVSTGITHFSKNYANGKQSFINVSPAITKNIVDELMEHLKFNMLYIMPKFRNNLNVNNINDYFGKKEGKFVIKLGGQEYVYDTYTKFIFDENIAITNQRIDKEGNPLTTANILGFSIDAIGKDTSTLPVNEGQTTEASIESILNNATETNPGDTVELVQALGFSNDKINTITGKTDNIPSLLPKTFYYDKTLDTIDSEGNKKKAQIQAITRGDKVIIGSAGVLELTGGKRRGLRLLVHERLHQLINEKSIFAKENIVNDLINTFNTAVAEARKINKGQEHYKAAQWLIDLVDNKGYNPKDYSSSINIENDTLTPERRFAEEWLVDSLTQPGLVDFLNSVHYDTEQINTTKETLWQKIIRVLMDILGVKSKNINNFTILAEHYNLLNDEVVEDTTNDNENNNVTPTEEETEQTPIVIDESVIEDVEEDYNIDDFDIFGDDFNSKFASITEFIDSSYIATDESYQENPTINPKGYIPFVNVEQYIQMYPEQDREHIAKLIENNEISFICK